jgi:hypothetical protein
VHFNNGLLHTAVIHRTFLHSHHKTKSLQPPFSPNVARSDFDYFSKLKMELKMSEFDDEQAWLNDVPSPLEQAQNSRSKF